VIVVDDASSDSSVSILREFEESIVFLPQNTNRGVCATRNVGSAVATGDYLVFLDGDDVLAPWALELYRRVAEAKRPKIILASLFFFGRSASIRSDAGQWDAPINNIDVSAIDIEIVNFGILSNKDRSFRRSGTAMVIERALFNRIGGWTENMRLGGDTEMLLKMLYEEPTIQILSPFSAYYREHDNNATLQVRRYCASIMNVINLVKNGQYTPAGRKRSDAYAFLAGQVLYWIQTALKAKEYRSAFKMLTHGSPMVFVAITRKIAGLAKGRLPSERLGPLKEAA
jgi:glycosyltransferase involved in cell wall biosynthesis